MIDILHPFIFQRKLGQDDRFLFWRFQKQIGLHMGEKKTALGTFLVELTTINVISP